LKEVSVDKALVKLANLLDARLVVQLRCKGTIFFDTCKKKGLKMRPLFENI